MRRVLVSDILKIQRRPVDIDVATEYTLIGVYSFGKGIFHREPQPGIDLGDYKFSKIQPGDLVMSNIQAWEGAIGFATERDRDTIGTHRFLSYVPRRDGEIDTNWARYYFLSPAGFPSIQKAAPGSVTRNRTLAQERFEAIELPLPDIEQQRRTAAHLDSVTHRAARLRNNSTSAPRNVQALFDAAVEQVFEAGIDHGWDLVPLGTVAEINPKRTKVDDDEEVMFVPMRSVDHVMGRIAQPESRLASEVRSGYKQFMRGDVIFARITPSMQNGKSAVVTADLPIVGFGSSEFHVIRPSATVLAAWIHTVVRSQNFRIRAANRFTGTAGQQRVPADFLESALIPLPPTTTDQEEAIERITMLRDRYLELHHLNKRRIVLADAIRPSALNRAFLNLS